MSQSKMTGGNKSFAIKHVFEAVSKMAKNKMVDGDWVTHFGLDWRLRLHWEEKVDNYLSLQCRKVDDEDKWTVKANITMELPEFGGKEEEKKPIMKIAEKGEKKKQKKKVAEKEGKKKPETEIAEKNEPTTMYKFDQNQKEITFFKIKWAEMQKQFEKKDWTVECHVTLVEMSGNFEKKKLMNFDESNKKFSDVVLVVDREKFYVMKKFLADHSKFLKDVFFENRNPEIELSYPDAQDFQNLLELLHKKSPVTDDTVEGILRISKFLSCETAFKKCDEFLMNRSKIPLETKRQFAIDYPLDALKKKFMSEMKT